jgi:hypothetical protein
MLNLIIPNPLLLFIDGVRGRKSRATYILKCVDYIKTHDITIDTNEGGKENDRIKDINKRGQNTSNNVL